MADLNLDEIEARANAATKGPWFCNGSFRIFGPGDCYHKGRMQTVARVRACQEYRFVEGTEPGSEESKAEDRSNAIFIAHAREDVPALIAEIRRLKEKKC